MAGIMRNIYSLIKGGCKIQTANKMKMIIKLIKRHYSQYSSKSSTKSSFISSPLSTGAEHCSNNTDHQRSQPLLHQSKPLPPFPLQRLIVTGMLGLIPVARHLQWQVSVDGRVWCNGHGNFLVWWEEFSWFSYVMALVWFGSVYIGEGEEKFQWYFDLFLKFNIEYWIPVI